MNGKVLDLAILAVVNGMLSAAHFMSGDPGVFGMLHTGIAVWASMLAGRAWRDDS